MSEMILAVGCGSIGASLGFLLGIITKKFLSPKNIEYRQMLKENEEYHKTQLGRMRARLKEYEQPSELQRFANGVNGQDPKDLVGLLANELPNLRGLPKWVRPLIPGISSYLKENPDQVQALIAKFANKTGKESLSTQDSL
jgi:hypothetical protein